MAGANSESQLAGLATSELWDDAWRRLARAVRDPRHAFRNVVVATHCPKRGVRARTVVLRSARAAPAMLGLYTDRRAQKIAGLESRPEVSWCFYDGRRRLQLRFETRAVVHIDDAIARAAWDTQSEAARALLRSEPAPGSPLAELEAPSKRRISTERDAGFENFAVVECAVTEADWLLLGRGGHRRVHFARSDDESWVGTDVVP